MSKRKKGKANKDGYSGSGAPHWYHAANEPGTRPEWTLTGWGSQWWANFKADLVPCFGDVRVFEFSFDNRTLRGKGWVTGVCVGPGGAGEFNVTDIDPLIEV